MVNWTEVKTEEIPHGKLVRVALVLDFDCIMTDVVMGAGGKTKKLDEPVLARLFNGEAYTLVCGRDLTHWHLSNGAPIPFTTPTTEPTYSPDEPGNYEDGNVSKSLNKKRNSDV